MLSRHFSSFYKPEMPKHKIILDQTNYRLAHAVYNSVQEAEKVYGTHHKPQGIRDWVAFAWIKMMIFGADIISRRPKMNEKLFLRRLLYLETMGAAVGLAAPTAQHMRHVIQFKGGEEGQIINHLVEESDNERVHLYAILELKRPSLPTRIAVLMFQTAFFLMFTTIHFISPRVGFRYIGYLEEEAFDTYTKIIKGIDEGTLPEWKNYPAPSELKMYYMLPDDAVLRDAYVCVRADEVMHREVNHHLGDGHKDVYFMSDKAEVKKTKPREEYGTLE